MRAVMCKAWGPPGSLVVEEVPSPTPGAGEVVVTVKAAGLNFPDVLMIQNKYQWKPPLPFSPGSELSGIVKEVGVGVTGIATGDAVVALVDHGAFAEECLVPAARVMPLPSGIDFETAAAFTLAYGTSHHALADRGALKAGETLLVLGAAGGVGLAAVEIGKAMGARVIACASTEEKLAVAKAHGADETIDYAKEDLRERIKALTGGRGADVIYDPVGGTLAEPALRSIAWRGRFLVVGFAGGEIPRIPLNLLLLKGCSLVGVFWGEWTRREPKAFSASMRELIGWLKDGKLRPLISARHSLDEAPAALSAMQARRVTGKVVIVP